MILKPLHLRPRDSFHPEPPRMWSTEAGPCGPARRPRETRAVLPAAPDRTPLRSCLPGPRRAGVTSRRPQPGESRRGSGTTAPFQAASSARPGQLGSLWAFPWVPLARASAGVQVPIPRTADTSPVTMGLCRRHSVKGPKLGSPRAPWCPPEKRPEGQSQSLDTMLLAQGLERGDGDCPGLGS